MYDDLMIGCFPPNEGFDSQMVKPGKLSSRRDIRPLLKGAYSRV